jgi:two-component system chemotaxis response regulator CheB
VQVLVIDDSAVVREVMTGILSHAGMEVAVAADPLIGMSKIERSRPDVILLDVEMPRMDGIAFLQKQMAIDPIPVVICSSLAGRGSEVAMRALQEGAVAVIEKPQFGLRESIEHLAAGLIDTLKEAAQAKMNVVRCRNLTDAAPMPFVLAFSDTTDKVVVIGASIGGTEAVRFLLESLPVSVPGIVIVQHMPQSFTAAFAKQLNSTCKLQVKEAVDGDRIMNGRALIAPGNLHTMVRRSGAHYVVEVGYGPLACRHRPSVDVLFQSAAKAAGRNAIGMILTGMGDDGASGLLDMKNAGAKTFAQDEASSVVFGMAKEAIKRGAVSITDVLPLDRIPIALMSAVRAQ